MKPRAYYLSLLCRLTSIWAEFGTARCLSPWGDLLVPVDHLVDHHAAVDAAPGMNGRRRTGLYEKAVVIDREPIASLAIHDSSPDPVTSYTPGTGCGMPGLVA